MSCFRGLPVLGRIRAAAPIRHGLAPLSSRTKPVVEGGGLLVGTLFSRHFSQPSAQHLHPTSSSFSDVRPGGVPPGHFSVNKAPQTFERHFSQSHSNLASIRSSAELFMDWLRKAHTSSKRGLRTPLSEPQSSLKNSMDSLPLNIDTTVQSTSVSTHFLRPTMQATSDRTWLRRLSRQSKDEVINAHRARTTADSGRINDQVIPGERVTTEQLAGYEGRAEEGHQQETRAHEEHDGALRAELLANEDGAQKGHGKIFKKSSGPYLKANLRAARGPFKPRQLSSKSKKEKLVQASSSSTLQRQRGLGSKSSAELAKESTRNPGREKGGFFMKAAGQNGGGDQPAQNAETNASRFDAVKLHMLGPIPTLFLSRPRKDSKRYQ